MKPLRVSLFLIATSAIISTLAATGLFGQIPPRPLSATLLGMMGVAIALQEFSSFINRRLNRLPDPPYFAIGENGGGELILANDGSYESCQVFLKSLAKEFQATSSKHLDAGPRSDKGFWNVKLRDEEYFVMRYPGGLSFSGPSSRGETETFVQIAEYFGAIEFKAWQRKLRSRD